MSYSQVKLIIKITVIIYSMLLFVNMLVIGITSRALFDLDESHGIFQDKGLEAYKGFQVANENIPLNPLPEYSILEFLTDTEKDMLLFS